MPLFSILSSQMVNCTRIGNRGYIELVEELKFISENS